MEPTSPTPHGFSENGPNFHKGTEIPLPQSPEQPASLEVPAPQERLTGAGVGEGPSIQVPPVVPTVIPAPTITQQSVNDNKAVDNNPTEATDDGLIEKQWVERAKKVISETKQDPYMQEKAFSQLQADYLRKRYGKNLKLPEEE